MPGLEALLKALEAAGIPKAIATSSGPAFVANVLDRFSLAPRFQFILTCDDIVDGKPHPEIYQTAAKRFGVEPAEMLVLEDSQNGCRAAVAAGAFAVAVPAGHSESHDFTGAKLVIDTLADPRLYAAIGLTPQLRSHIVIPARLASTRLPRKLLLVETGKPLIEHTYRAAQQASRPSGVIVAADHEEIAGAVRAFGGEVVMTSPACASGTDRVAEVAHQLPNVDILVNVQGDEPELSGEAIDLVVDLLAQNPDMVMATLATPIRDREKLNDPSCVKVAFDHRGRALYFSRSPIPHAREWRDELLDTDPASFYQHVGLYAYRRDFLLRLADLPRTPLERLENLEQLRVLENGYSIIVGIIDEPTIGIDTPHDYRAFVERHQSRNRRGD